MILIFNLKRKRLYRVFLVPSFMAEARGLKFRFAKSFHSSSLRKIKVNFYFSLVSSSGPTYSSHPLANINKKRPKGLFYFHGGSERIRTSETFRPTRFRVVRLQPLGHASTSYFSKKIPSPQPIAFYLRIIF